MAHPRHAGSRCAGGLHGSPARHRISWGIARVSPILAQCRPPISPGSDIDRPAGQARVISVEPLLLHRMGENFQYMLRRTVFALVTLAWTGVLAGCDQPLTATAPAAPICPFQVTNNASMPVRNLHFNSSGMLAGWGSDQLGGRVLSRGRSQGFRPSSPGTQDVRIVWANGRAAELRQVDTCRTARISVTTNGLVAR